MLYIFTLNEKKHQVKRLMFNNVQTTNLTFIGKKKEKKKEVHSE